MHAKSSPHDPTTLGYSEASADPAAGTPALPADCAFLAPAQRPDELGRLGHYRILSVLGKGGMGMVFLAEDTKLERQVALKVMLPKYAEDAAAKVRFLREAKLAAAIEHDHIVHIYQVDEDRGVPFLAMQLLSGSSLEDVLRRAGRLTVPQLLRLGAQIAEGLAIAHGKGLIHRDIKPANIWVEANYGGRVKLLDFGLARAVETDVGITQSGVILGTPAYMPPEQARGEHVDQRCDLYSLGCVLYRMATGTLPIQGKDTMALLMALAMNEPTPPRQLNATIPSALNDLIVKLLAKEASQRPESAKAVAQALRKIEQGLTRANVPNDVTGELAALAQLAAPPPPSSTIPEPSNPFANQSGTAPSASAPADSDGTHLRPGQTTQIRAVLTQRKYALTAVTAGLLVAIAVAMILVRQTPPGPMVPGDSEWALEFDGTTSHVLVPDLKLPAHRPFTIEAQAKLRDPKNSPQRVLAAVGGLTGLYCAPADGGGTGTAEIWLARYFDKPQNATPKGTLQVGRKVHLACVWDGVECWLYLNGIRQGCYNNGTGAIQDIIGLTIGARIDNAGKTVQAFRGEIDEVRISSVARYGPEDYTPKVRFESDKDTLALYHFDEGQGDKLTDSSGNGHHGKIVGAKWVTADGLVKVPARPASVRLRFDGESSYVEIPSLRLDNDEPITLEGLVTVDQEQNSMNLVRVAGNSWMSLSAGGRKWGVIGVRNSEQHGVIAPDTVRRGETTHVAGTWNGKQFRLFVNGKEFTERLMQKPKPVTLKSGQVAITHFGGTPGGSGFLLGTIHGIRMSRSVRYVQPFVPPQSLESDDATLALYRFDEGQGDKLTDSSGNDHHGKIVGAKWVRVAAPPRTDAELAVACQDIQLRTLDLQGALITDEGLQHVIRLKNLETLNLSGTPIDGAGLRHLETVAMLKELRLANCPQLKTAHLAALTKLHGPLETLDLRGTPIDNGAEAHLRRLGLHRLDVRCTKMTMQGVKDLAASAPGCYIESDHGAFGPRR